jgi:hypothetical protein
VTIDPSTQVDPEGDPDPEPEGFELLPQAVKIVMLSAITLATAISFRLVTLTDSYRVFAGGLASRVSRPDRI